MYAQTRNAIRPIDLCVLEAERKRTKAQRPRREPSKSVQFAGTAVLIGSLFFLAFMIPLAVIVQSSTHSLMWLFGVPVIALASLIFGGILAGNTGFDLDEAAPASSTSRSTTTAPQVAMRRPAQATRPSGTIHTAA